MSLIGDGIDRDQTASSSWDAIVIGLAILCVGAAAAAVCVFGSQTGFAAGLVVMWIGGLVTAIGMFRYVHNGRIAVVRTLFAVVGVLIFAVLIKTGWDQTHVIISDARTRAPQQELTLDDVRSVAASCDITRIDVHRDKATLYYSFTSYGHFGGKELVTGNDWLPTSKVPELLAIARNANC